MGNEDERGVRVRERGAGEKVARGWRAEDARERREVRAVGGDERNAEGGRF